MIKLTKTSAGYTKPEIEMSALESLSPIAQSPTPGGISVDDLQETPTDWD